MPVELRKRLGETGRILPHPDRYGVLAELLQVLWLAELGVPKSVPDLGLTPERV